MHKEIGKVNNQNRRDKNTKNVRTNLTKYSKEKSRLLEKQIAKATQFIRIRMYPAVAAARVIQERLANSYKTNDRNPKQSSGGRTDYIRNVEVNRQFLRFSNRLIGHYRRRTRWKIFLNMSDQIESHCSQNAMPSITNRQHHERRMKANLFRLSLGDGGVCFSCDQVVFFRRRPDESLSANRREKDSFLR